MATHAGNPAAGDQQAWDRIDTTTPHTARMYDYFLGGKDHFAPDREAAEKIIQAYPQIRDLARHNRRFLVRAVEYVASHEVRQFIDIGAGFPTTGMENTHEVVRREAPQARVTYVDNDPVVLVHARALLADQHTSSVVAGDLRKPETILAHPDLRAAIDLTQPVGLLLVAILHFIRDEEDPVGIVGTLLDAVAPGSYLILTHGSPDFSSPDRAAEGIRIYEQASAPLVLRPHAQIERFLHGLELVEPGLVQLPQWRPDGPLPATLDRISAYAAVARKPS